MSIAPEHTEANVEKICPVELQPLDPQATLDRRDIHTRLIGPLTTIAVIYAIDSFREADSNAVAHHHETLEQAYEKTIATKPPAINRFVRWADPFDVHLGQELADSLFNPVETAFFDASQPDPRYVVHKRGTFLTKEQKELFERTTALRYFEDLVREGLLTQQMITFRLALPGYLAAKHELKTSDDVYNRVRELSLSGLANIIAGKDFNQSLARLALTANGLLKDGSKPYVDRADMYSALDLSAPIHRECVDMPAPVSLFELYQKQSNGSYKLSSATHAVLKYYLNFRNHVEDPHKKMGGAPGPTSRGCPVVQRSVRVREDDFSEQQWDYFLKGGRPIASFNDKAGKLTFLRTAMEETSQLFVDILRGEPSSV